MEFFFFYLYVSLNRRLTGVRRDNHIGGGALSLEDMRATIAIPDGLSNNKHILGGHDMIPVNIASFANQYLMNFVFFVTITTFEIFQIVLETGIAGL